MSYFLFSVLFLYTHVHVWLWYLYFLSCHCFIPVWHFPVFFSHEIALLVFFLVYSFQGLGFCFPLLLTLSNNNCTMRICCQFSLEVHAFCGLLACRKTALMLALCEALRDKYSIAAVSALFLPYTPKYNLCSPRPSHHHEQLERNKRSETR